MGVSLTPSMYLEVKEPKARVDSDDFTLFWDKIFKKIFKEKSNKIHIFHFKEKKIFFSVLLEFTLLLMT